MDLIEYTETSLTETCRLNYRLKLGRQEIMIRFIQQSNEYKRLHQVQDEYKFILQSMWRSKQSKNSWLNLTS